MNIMAEGISLRHQYQDRKYIHLPVSSKIGRIQNPQNIDCQNVNPLFSMYNDSMLILDAIWIKSDV